MKTIEIAKLSEAEKQSLPGFIMHSVDLPGVPVICRCQAATFDPSTGIVTVETLESEPEREKQHTCCECGRPSGEDTICDRCNHKNICLDINDSE